jgi:hypothetical protein
VFRYDGANPSKIMLPPHLDGKWLVSDWWKGTLEVISLSPDGAAVTARSTLMPQYTFQGPLDFKIGPDGSLYVVEYGQASGGLWFSAANNTSISRIEYTGGCHPATPVPTTIAAQGHAPRTDLVPNAILGMDRQVPLPEGAQRFDVFDLRGRKVWEYRVTGFESGMATVPMRAGMNGLLRIRFGF